MMPAQSKEVRGGRPLIPTGSLLPPVGLDGIHSSQVNSNSCQSIHSVAILSSTPELLRQGQHGLVRRAQSQVQIPALDTGQLMSPP